MKRFYLCIAFLTWSLTGCSVFDPSASKEGSEVIGFPSVETEASSYRFTDEEVTIGVLYRNEGKEAVYLDSCGESGVSYVLEKRVGDNWKVVFQPICQLIEMPPVEVEPGGVHAANVEIYNRENPDALPNLEVNKVSGEYRLVLSIRSSGVGELLPEDRRVSNVFNLMP